MLSIEMFQQLLCVQKDNVSNKMTCSPIKRSQQDTNELKCTEFNELASFNFRFERLRRSLTNVEARQLIAEAQLPSPGKFKSEARQETKILPFEH